MTVGHRLTPVAEFFWHMRSQAMGGKTARQRKKKAASKHRFSIISISLSGERSIQVRILTLSDSVLQDLLSTSTLGTTILAEASAKFAAGVYDVATAGSAMGGLFQLLGKALTYFAQSRSQGPV